ncbi:MAG: hypothetical protein M1837_000954 [Sclerophora amabilis]|nr:MAG: hypothetical protein M1837_000954 [Sclerophora amabilis]
MTLEEPCLFASEDWCTIPFFLHAKSPFDKFVDILVQLPGCLPLRIDMERLKEEEVVASENSRRGLVMQAEKLLSLLDQFWEQHRWQVDPDYDKRWYSNYLMEECGLRDVASPYGGGAIFTNTFTATFTALYDAANIIVLRNLTAASSPTTGIHSRRITAHAASVLASIAYHEAAGPFSGGSFSMVFPLKVVCFLSTSERQRSAAQEALLSWGANRGMTDIT